MVDTNDDDRPDTPFVQAISAAENLRLNPAATRQQLAAVKHVLEEMNE